MSCPFVLLAVSMAPGCCLPVVVLLLVLLYLSRLVHHQITWRFLCYCNNLQQRLYVHKNNYCGIHSVRTK